MTSMSTFVVQGERILADAKLFVDSKQDNNNQITGLKNSIMQNLTSHKEILDKSIERVRTKITKLNKIISNLKNENVEMNKDFIISIVNKEIKNALKSYEIPLKKISRFNSIEACNSIDCLKHQISALHQ